MNPWIRRFEPAPAAALRLVCLAHAGGAASTYFAMAKALAPEIEVLAIQYPGRQDRCAEPPLTSITELARGVVSALGDSLDHPIALFGHSMGALVGYEAAKQLAVAGVPPRTLFVSGCRAPNRERSEGVHTRTDEGVLAEVRSLAGTQSALLGDDDFLRLFLPAIRGDYQAVETYHCRPFPPLPIPIRVLVGKDDPKVSLEEALAWREFTSTDWDLRAYSGGHFFLNQHLDQVIRYLSSVLGVGAPAPFS